MEANEVLQELRSYNDHELFYKEYLEAKKDPDSLHDFLKMYPVEKTKEKQWIVEEYKSAGGWYPENMDDALMFSMSEGNDIVLTKHNRYTPAFSHRHTFFEFAYVVEGACTHVFQKDTLHLKKGQLLILPPFTIHQVKVFDDSIVINILVKRKMFETLFHTIFCESNPIRDYFNQSLYLFSCNGSLWIDTNKNEALRDVVLEMYDQSIKKKKYSQTILLSLLAYWFGKVLQNQEAHIHIPKFTATNKTLLKILDHIERNFETITLSHIAETFHFSQAYVSRMIKKQTGKSFTDLLLDLKFEKATYWLETRTDSIQQIAYDSGFESIEHFNRLFKKRFLITPGQYRKLNQQKEKNRRTNNEFINEGSDLYAPYRSSI
ncbi:AraC family transcriptional regulator [Dubosiella newyorkensis]|uniref:AraC family transcriptional regulator n=1 Tax=Dubosiella newyorkensis TaxID=1862672 RepID=UPI00267708EF|nr:AraC family transcriptional regulator [Dubosiella newyorkensis]